MRDRQHQRWLPADNSAQLVSGGRIWYTGHHVRVGLGVANLAGAAFCAYPSTGSFARSAVQSTSGAKTGVLQLSLSETLSIVLAACG